MNKRVAFKVSLQCMIFDKQNQILLLKRKNTGYFDGMYSLPGGHLEDNEDIVSGMIREINEEIGIQFKSSDLELIKIVNRKVHNENYLDFIFKGFLNDYKPINKEKDKCERILYRSVDKIPIKSVPILKRIIRDDEFYISMEEKND